jgi:hypothetical protein
MCHKLIQTYVCGDTAIVCTTPCPHALRTATLVPAAAPSPSDTPSTPTLTSSTTATSPADRDLDRPLPPTPTSPPPPYDPSSPSSPAEEPERIPNLCTYFFPRRLPTSSHPCLKCYMRPEYEAYRKRWMDHYRGEHPGQKNEKIEELSGVEQVSARVGLVNVVLEMDRMG